MCQRGVKPVFQNSFSRGEKHRHECNQVCNSASDLNNILSSQKHLSTNIFKAHGSKKKKTHTHKTSLTNFIFKKKKSRQFSEHTLIHVKPCDG